MEWISSPEAWIALLSLTVLEIVLGIDNIVFISILSARLPKEQQARARTIGLGLATGFIVWFAAVLMPYWHLAWTLPSEDEGLSPR